MQIVSLTIGIWYSMQIVSSGDILHEMSNPIFWGRGGGGGWGEKKKDIISLLFDAFDDRSRSPDAGSTFHRLLT